MNALIKKEIRLLLPSWIVAIMLAMVQGITRPYDFYVASLLFFGLTIMALTTIGRETSLNTFSSLLAQPTQRIQIWQAKLSVLAVAFLTVFAVWIIAFGVAFFHSNADTSDADSSYNLFITVCLIATATFTGGLWTTLLLRQLAGAFWLTLLVPAVLSGFSAVFLAQAESSSLVIAVLSVVIAVYSVGGFLFARWLFFRAQDVGWSGGIIAVPQWKLFARSENTVSARNQKPIFALIKKELQLHQVSLMGAASLLVLHLGIITLRKYHHFEKESAGEIITSIFWMLWLVMAPVIGSMAVAEERRMGVMEGQLCLPVSRRVQFGVKAALALLLGIFFGGVMPVLVEYIGVGLGAYNPMFSAGSPSAAGAATNIFWPGLAIMSLAGWLTLLSFFGSTLSRSFLQAVGFGIAAFFISSALLVINGQKLFQGFMSVNSALPVVVAVPTLIATLLWLAYLNYKNFHGGWTLWRRNLLGFAGAFVFVIVASVTLYHRAWEIFEPAEPAHGPAKFSLENRPVLSWDSYNNLLVRLPDGRVWSDYLGYGHLYDADSGRIKWLLCLLVDPLPKITGTQRFVAGSNWVSVSVRRVDFLLNYKEGRSLPNNHVVGYLDAVGVRTDGTLWISDASKTGVWTGDKMNRFANATNWQQLMRARNAVLLLKTDGTLWQWGSNHLDWSHWQTNWPGLHAYQPRQIGTHSDWKEIYTANWINFARKTNGTVWNIDFNDKTGECEFVRDASFTSFDQAALQTLSVSGNGERAHVRPNGTLWLSWDFAQSRTNRVYADFVQVGTETNWSAVAITWRRLVALKTDGSLWEWHFARQWNTNQQPLIQAAQQQPIRLGSHQDWVALTQTWEDVIALAGDGSLWLWPERERYEQATLLKLSKQPKSLGNIFNY